VDCESRSHPGSSAGRRYFAAHVSYPRPLAWVLATESAVGRSCPGCAPVMSSRFYCAPTCPPAIGILPFAPVFLVVSVRPQTPRKGRSFFSEIRQTPKDQRERLLTGIGWPSCGPPAHADLPVFPASAAAKAAWGSAVSAARRWRSRPMTDRLLEWIVPTGKADRGHDLPKDMLSSRNIFWLLEDLSLPHM